MTTMNPSQALPRAVAIDRRAFAYRYDVLFMLAVAGVVVFGLVMVASASTSIANQVYGDPLAYFWRQLIHVGVAVGAAGLVVRVPVRIWERIGPTLILAAMVLLVLVLIPGIGREVNGSRRWLAVGAFNLQPSEFSKLFIILYLAGYLVRRAEEVRHVLFGFIKPILLLVGISILLFVEPDYGAIVVLFIAVFGMLYLAGVPIVSFLVVAVGVIVIVSIFALVEPYRVERLMSFVNPWSDPFDSGFQLTQALIAIGRGGWLGVGLGESVQKLFYLPEAHTDFLFAVFAEEFGLVGMVTLIAFFTFLVFRSLWIGRCAEKMQAWFAAYTAYGIGLLFGVQVFVNLGVNLGLLPTKGLTLPLMSYGGSSLVASAVSIGILLRIDHERRVARCHRAL